MTVSTVCANPEEVTREQKTFIFPANTWGDIIDDEHVLFEYTTLDHTEALKALGYDIVSPMNPAELKTKREWLGLSSSQTGSILGVSGRTIRHWESSRYRIPEWAADQINNIVDLTEILEKTMASSTGFICTYQTDDDRPLDMWLPAAWHRAAAARVAHRTGRGITYQE